MKKYKLKVNGKVFEVEVEKVDEVGGSITSSNEQKVEAVSSGQGQVVEAPLQGKIFDVKVAVGDTVNSGQCVIVIEAMKMENEVLCSTSGKVTKILVAKGDDVDVDAPLVVVE